jgi:epsilon-lactone hydrolase
VDFIHALIDFFITCWSTFIRRLRKGPLRPTWGFIYEAGITFLRGLAMRAGGREDIRRMRTVAASFWLPPLTALLTSTHWDRVDGLRVKHIYPWGWKPGRVVLYLRGGAYVFSVAMHERLMVPFCLSAHAQVIVPFYRLAPENPFPAALEDALAIYRWMLAQGADPQRVIFAGDSAGGGLALALMDRIRNLGLPLPRLAVLLSPWVDLACSGDSMDENHAYDWISREVSLRMAACYAPEACWRDPLISPLHLDVSGFPPIYIQAGEAEVLRDQIVVFSDRARAQGAKVLLDLYPDMVHEFQAFDRFTPQSRQALSRLGRVIDEFMDG